MSVADPTRRREPPDRVHILDVRGDFACFSRPELAVERYSYPLPTPSAARGVLEAVYFKPEFRWQVVKIESLTRPSYIALRRNEVKGKISERALLAGARGKEIEPFWADGDDDSGRTQRQTMALRDPHFRIHARIVPRSGRESQQAAFDEQFVRRASQGKCFAQPCLGCKEFVAFFRLVEDLSNEPLAEKSWSQSLGLMLYDTFDLREDNHEFVLRDREPKSKGDAWKNIHAFVTLFRAEVKAGVMEVPPYESADVIKPEGRPR